jgi:hypothetical protein
MMLNSHIAKHYNASLAHDAHVAAARARMVARAGRPRIADRLRNALARPFPRGRVVAAKSCS